MMLPKNRFKVAVAVSGGVDSAVAALLLKLKGYDIIGVFMKNWDEHDEFGSCSILNDRADAEYVCKHLVIPFKEVNFVKEYWAHVFSYMLQDYQLGYTPNPDIMCNRHIKFDAFLQFCLEELKANFVATGHYARSSYGPFLEHRDSSSEVKLLQPEDTFKDQTFFLSQISQSSLQNVMFPLGDFLKLQVKQIAIKHGLMRVARKKESTGMCFIGKRKFQTFISDYLSTKPGAMIDLTSGETVSEHAGFHLWTIGQCCHLKGFNSRYFIAAKLPESNTIYVVPGTSHPALFSSVVYANHLHFIRSQCIFNSFGILQCYFRFQHTKPIVPCRVFLAKGMIIILLDKPLKAITPGQFAVFYRNNECLGSARIVQIGATLHSLNQVVPNNYKENEHFYYKVT